MESGLIQVADMSLAPASKGELLTATQAAEYLNTNDSTFRGWRGKFNKEHPNESIKGIRNGKNQMYSLTDLDRLKSYVTPRAPKKKVDNISLIDDSQPQQPETKKAPTVEAKDLTIDDEFKNLIQPLTDSEYNQLEEGILQNGIINPVLVIRDEASNNFTIIDGHHRHAIATKHGLPIPIKEMTFNSRDEVEFWIVKNQFARRNLSPFERGLLVLKMESVISARAKENQGKRNDLTFVGNQTNVSNGVDTLQEMAEMAGISRDAMYKIRLIEREGTPEMKQQIREGISSINKAYEEVRAAKAPEPKSESPALVDTFEVDESPQQPKSPNYHNELKAENQALKEEIAELKGKAYNLQGTGNNERYTPAEIIALVREVLDNIDLDPASSEVANETVGADTFYSADDDGLTKDWTGKIFMNPPYSKDLIEKFVDKLIDSPLDEAITLTHNCTETSWGGKLLKNSTAVSFPTGRIDCKTPSGDGGSPKQGSMICYFGSNVDKFINTFGRIGVCLKK